MAIPLALKFLMPALIQSASVVDLSNPIMQGYKFELDFFRNVQLRNYQWKVRAVRHSDSSEFIDLTFPSIACAGQQQVDTFKEKTKEMNKIHYLKPGHPVVDAVCKAQEEHFHTYLVMMQISLSSYAKHKSKFEDIYALQKLIQSQL